MFRSTTTARRFCLLLILLAAGALCVPSSQSSASVPDRSVPDRSVPARSVPARNVAPVIDSGGYAWISYFRGLAGLGPVTRNSVLEAPGSACGSATGSPSRTGSARPFTR